jgi:hypothetical protein
MVLIGLGVVVSFIGGIMFLIAAFKEGVGWGLAVMFIPFAQLVFLVKYWSQARVAFLAQVIGVALGFAAVRMGAAAGMESLFPEDQSGPAETGAAAALARIQNAAERRVVRTRDPDNNKYIGMPLREVRKELGRPAGILRSDGRVTYFYAHVEIVSADGTNVTSQHRPAK